MFCLYGIPNVTLTDTYTVENVFLALLILTL